MTAYRGIGTDSVGVMDSARADPFFVRLKADLGDLLGVTEGMRVLEVGCGTGEETVTMAAAAGETGLACGVDVAWHMVQQAKRRARVASAAFVRADGAALPLAAGSMHACRIERVLQHVASPAAVLAEARRVLMVGGRLAVAEPDWRGVLLHPLSDRTRAIVDAWVANNRNPAVGRSLPALISTATLQVRHIEMRAAVYTDLVTTEQFFPFALAVRAAVDGRLVDSATGEAWLDSLRAADMSNAFLFAVPVFVVLATRER